MQNAAKSLLNKKFFIIPKEPKEIRDNLFLAVSIGTALVFGSYSMQYIPLSVFAIILNLKPVLVIVLGFCFGIETITLKKISLIFLSFLGACMIVDPEWFARAFDLIVGNTRDFSDGGSPSDKGLF